MRKATLILGLVVLFGAAKAGADEYSRWRKYTSYEGKFTVEVPNIP